MKRWEMDRHKDWVWWLITGWCHLERLVRRLRREA